MRIENLIDYPAIIHCHSTYSDGSKTIPEIASIAESVGVKFLMMSDHNHLRPIKDGHNRWNGNVLVDIGYEINDEKDLNHFLAFGLNSEVNRTQRAKDYVRDVDKNGGFGFIAHPNEERTKMPGFRIYPWTDWDIGHFTGIEIWNHMSAWMEGLSSINKYKRVLHPRQSVWGPKQKTLDLWDKIALQRRVTGIGGADAHGHEHVIYRDIKINIFRYKIIFKCLRTYIVTDKKISTGMPYDEARILLHDSLKKASAYFAQYYLGNPSGFRFWGSKKDKVFPMGSEFPFENDLRINAVIPQKRVKWYLYRNGSEISTGKSTSIDLMVKEPGVYRLVVDRKDRPWLYSNHLYIRPEK